jgi:hypothetical protein
MKMVFYNYGGIKKYLILADGFQQEYELREWEQIELPFINTENLIVLHDGEEINYSEYIKGIGQNKLYISP